MKNTYVIPLLSLAGCVTLSTETEAKAKQKAPNVVLIMVDDMGYGDFGCYGNTYHKTPNIDLLAKKGAKLTDFHTNGAVSSPTRAALMTGRYQQYYGIEGVVTAKSHRHAGLSLEAVTIAELLKSNGYSTAIYGKWHLGYDKKFNPINQGFDEFVGYVSGNVDYFSHVDQEMFEDWWKQDSLHPEEGYTTDLIANYAIDYLKRKHKAPFFLYLPFEATHGPYQAPQDGVIRKAKEGDKKYEKRDIKLVYKQMVESLDDAIGEIMKTIKAQGLDDNTLVLFFSDNGGSSHSCNAPLSGKKGNVLEGGHRVSSIAYFPQKIKAGTVIDETIMTMDVMSTLCEFTGTSMKKVTTDGTSFWGVLTRGEKMPERTLFWRTGTLVGARKGDWKLIYMYKNNKTKKLIDKSLIKPRLYNLKDDLAEKNDVSAEHPEIVKQLIKEIENWQEGFKDIPQLS